MKAMDLKVAIGVDLKQFKKDMDSVKQIANQFGRDTASNIDVGVNVDVDEFEQTINEIADLAESVPDIDINGDADLDVSNYEKNAGSVVATAKDTEDKADVNGDADLTTTNYDSGISSVESSAFNADADVNGTADLSTTNFDTALSGVEEDAAAANADVDGVADLDLTDYSTGISDVESAASGASADVSGKATLNTTSYGLSVNTVETRAEGADADIEGKATLDPSEYNAVLSSLEETANNADIDVSATVDTSGIDGALDGIESGSSAADDALSSIGAHADYSAVIDGLNGIGNVLESIIQRAFNVGASLANLAIDSSTWADDLITESQKYNNEIDSFSTTTIQQMRYASQFIDTDVSMIEGSLSRLTRNMKEAQGGNKELTQSFNSLGVKITDTEGKLRPTIEVFWDTIDSLGQIENQAEQDAAAIELLGRNISDLKPLMLAGSDAYKELMENAPVVAEEQVLALGQLNDAYNDMQSQLEVTKLELMAELAPALTEAMTKVSELIQQFREFAQTDEGQAAINGMKDSITGLINSLTGENSIEKVFTTLEGVIEKLTDGLQWVADNSATVVGAFEAIGGAIVAIKVSESVLTFLNLIKGAKGLLGGGGAAAEGGGAAAAGGGGLFSLIGNGLRALFNSPVTPWGLFAGTVAGTANVMDRVYTKSNYGEYNQSLDDMEERVAALESTYDKQNTQFAEMMSTVGDLMKSLTEGDKSMFTDEELNQIKQAVETFQGKTDKDYSEILTAIEELQNNPDNAAGIYSELLPALGTFLHDMETESEEMVAKTEEARTRVIEMTDELIEAKSDVEEAATEAVAKLEETGVADNLGDELETQITQGGAAGAAATEQSITDGVGSGGESGSESMKFSLIEAGAESASALEAMLRRAIANAANSAPSWMTSVLSDDDPDAYKEAGEWHSYLKHSSAMSGGEILHGLTPFGVDSNGIVHYGGEAGAEAVVGVNSLDRMIQDAVTSALAGVLSRMDALSDSRNMKGMQIVLDTGAVVGGLVGEMDHQLAAAGKWRGGGHA